MKTAAKKAPAKKSGARRASAKVYCGICSNWEIKNPERCSNTLKQHTGTVYFCTKRCKERYAKAPEKFAHAGR